jgi:hypothetical protein
MNIVNINNAPTVHDEDGCIRYDVRDFNRIIDNIDKACGRNDALRAYIYRLRDLQRANDESCFDNNDAAIDRAEAAVVEAFERLIVAQRTLFGAGV